MHAADMTAFFRAIPKRSVIGATILLAMDGGMYGTCLAAWAFCPIWFLVSLLKNAIERPGWRIASVRIGIPAVTFGLLWANNEVQLGVAEANAPRVVAACEEYHAANGKYPKRLVELVPRYMKSVPPAKYCMLGEFVYHNRHESPLLYWTVVPPHLRKIYNFETRRWSYLD